MLTTERKGSSRWYREGEDWTISGNQSTHKHLPSSLGAIHNPKNKTIFGCRHSAIILHSLSKYFITWSLASRRNFKPIIPLRSRDKEYQERLRSGNRGKVTYMIFLRRFNLFDCDIYAQVTPYPSAICVAASS